jgi:hypothetical protein
MISFNYNKNSQKIKSPPLQFTLILEFNAIFITYKQLNPLPGGTGARNKTAALPACRAAETETSGPT